MSVLIKRLRKEQQWGNSLDGEAADNIEKLQARIVLLEGYLRGALRGVIAIEDRDCPEFREAHAALKGETDD